MEFSFFGTIIGHRTLELHHPIYTYSVRSLDSLLSSGRTLYSADSLRSLTSVHSARAPALRVRVHPSGRARTRVRLPAHTHAELQDIKPRLECRFARSNRSRGKSKARPARVRPSKEEQQKEEEEEEERSS